MSEIIPIPTETKKTEQFTARVKPDDKTFIVDFIKKYPNQHEGFNAFVNLVKEPSEPTEPKIVEVEKKLAPNCFVIEFTTAFVEQLTALRRYLKSKNNIPAESTEAEFMQQIISHSTETYIKRNYDFLNR